MPTPAKKTPSTTPKAAPATTPKLESLAALNQVCRSTIELRVRTPAGMRSVMVQTLLPQQMCEIREILESVMPPFAKGPDGLPSDKLDFSDESYRRRLYEAKMVARSLGLWYAVPILRDGAPTETGTDRARIHAWVAQQGTDSILEQIWMAVSSDFTAERLEEAIGFFSPLA